METSLQVLIVEDSEDDTRLVVEALKDRGYQPTYQRVETPEEMKEALLKKRWDVILSDYFMPRFDALKAMRLMKDAGFDLPFIIISGSIGEEIAVAAMKAGAHDYMMKDNLSRLSPAIERERQEAVRRSEHRQAEFALQQSEERFRQLAESIEQVFWMKTFATNKVMYVSPSYERIWGRNRRELFENPESFIEWIHPDDRDRVIAALKKLPSQFYDLEYRIFHPDGSVRWIRDRAFPTRDEKGKTYRISGITDDVTEQKRANEKLKASRQQLRDLAARLDSIREKERTWIAREIHDELGQLFTGIKFELYHLQKSLSKSEGHRTEDKPAFGEKIKSTLDLVDAAIKSVQKIATELRPGILDELGLLAAIRWQTSEFQKRTGLICRFRSEIQTIPLDRDRTTGVFRIFQEIMTNVARHAGATHVQIQIKEKSGHLQIDVKDNGRGITPEEMADPKSLGLLGIRERMLLLAGETEINGVPQKGTHVRLKIPLQEAEGASVNAALPVKD